MARPPLMLSESGNIPAKLIKEFRRTSDKPILKGAYVQEMVFVGDDQLDLLIALKSKNELIADIVALLQSPVKNVISGLQSGGHKLIRHPENLIGKGSITKTELFKIKIVNV